MVRILINGSETVNRPSGVDQLSERYYFSEEFYGYLYEITGSLTFYGADFDYFYNLFKTSQCDSVTIELANKEGDNGNWKQIFKGLIYLKDLKFDADRRTVDAEIVDDSFIAKLINYADTPVELFLAQSRGGVPLPISGTLISVDDLQGNVIPNITGYTALDILNYIVGFITDTQITVQSNFLSTSPANKYWFVTGPNMRYVAAPMNVTFKQVLVDLLKVWNLRWTITKTAGQNILVIEPAQTFEESTYIQVDGLRDFAFEYYEKWDYSTFTFGSYNAVNTTDSGDPYIVDALKRPWAAHNDSSVTPDGSCASGRVLDLQTTLVCYDANAISDCLNNTSDSTYDETLFYVCDTADSTGTIYPNLRIVNPDLFAKYQLERWLNTYCFLYPGSLSSCDSWLFADGTYQVGSPDQIQFQIYDPEGCLFDNNEIPANVGMVNIELKLILEPDQTTPFTTGLARLFFTNTFNINEDFIAPDPTNGWTNGPASTQSPLRRYVDYAFNVTDIVIYEAFMQNILIQDEIVYLNLNLGFGDIGLMTVLEGSYIKVTNPASNIVYTDCTLGSFKVDASGFILPNKAEEIRNSRFGNLLLPNNFKNFSGPIIELDRKLVNGETKLNINTKTV